MENKSIGIVIGIIAVILVALFATGKISTEQKEGAWLEVKLNVIEPNVKAIITSPVKTKVDVTTVPFSLTVINGGQIPFTNVRLDAGTIPSTLAAAFASKTIVSLAPGASGVMIADVDVASLAPATGSTVVNFQAKIKADYVVAGNIFTKTGFTAVLPITVMPGAGISVTVTYE